MRTQDLDQAIPRKSVIFPTNHPASILEIKSVMNLVIRVQISSSKLIAHRSKKRIMLCFCTVQPPRIAKLLFCLSDCLPAARPVARSAPAAAHLGDLRDFGDVLGGLDHGSAAALWDLGHVGAVASAELGGNDVGSLSDWSGAGLDDDGRGHIGSWHDLLNRRSNVSLRLMRGSGL